MNNKGRTSLSNKDKDTLSVQEILDSFNEKAAIRRKDIKVFKRDDMVYRHALEELNNKETKDE